MHRSNQGISHLPFPLTAFQLAQGLGIARCATADSRFLQQISAEHGSCQGIRTEKPSLGSLELRGEALRGERAPSPPAVSLSVA